MNDDERRSCPGMTFVYDGIAHFAAIVLALFLVFKLVNWVAGPELLGAFGIVVAAIVFAILFLFFLYLFSPKTRR